MLEGGFPRVSRETSFLQSTFLRIPGEQTITNWLSVSADRQEFIKPPDVEIGAVLCGWVAADVAMGAASGARKPAVFGVADGTAGPHRARLQVRAGEFTAGY